MNKDRELRALCLEGSPTMGTPLRHRMRGKCISTTNTRPSTQQDDEDSSQEMVAVDQSMMQCIQQLLI